MSDVRDLTCKRCGKLWAVECHGATDTPVLDCCDPCSRYVQLYVLVRLTKEQLEAAAQNAIAWLTAAVHAGRPR